MYAGGVKEKDGGKYRRMASRGDEVLNFRATLGREPLCIHLRCASSPSHAPPTHTSAFMRLPRLPSGAARLPAIAPECWERFPKGMHGWCHPSLWSVCVCVFFYWLHTKN